MSNKLYDFYFGGTGWGETPEEAWENCKENYDLDKMDLPEYELIEEEDIDE